MGQAEAEVEAEGTGKGRGKERRWTLDTGGPAFERVDEDERQATLRDGRESE